MLLEIIYPGDWEELLSVDTGDSFHKHPINVSLLKSFPGQIAFYKLKQLLYTVC